VKNGILFIADEVQTGFGRTGKMFAMEHFEVIPDLMTMSKSIAAGLPISAVTGKAEIMDAPLSGEIGGTYGGSPLGCVAALEVIKMMEKENLPERANKIGETIIRFFQEIRDDIPFIGEVRTLGAMTSIEIVKNRSGKEPNKELTGKILQNAHQRGLILMSAGLYGNIIRILSPLVITDEQLLEGLGVLKEVMLELREG